MTSDPTPLSTTTVELGRAERSELLAAMEEATLVALADACIADSPDPELVVGPEVGVVVLTVREPVERTRMHLGEVLVSRAEVEHRGVRGWGMRPGDCPGAAVAAAVCDAEAAAAGPMVALIDQACDSTRRSLARERAAEWRSLEPTIVRFEEMN